MRRFSELICVQEVLGSALTHTIISSHTSQCLGSKGPDHEGSRLFSYEGTLIDYYTASHVPITLDLDSESLNL